MSAQRKLSVVRRLPLGTTMSRALVVRHKVIWPWRKLSAAQRKIVESASRPEFFDGDLLGRILDERNLRANARPR